MLSRCMSCSDYSIWDSGKWASGGEDTTASQDGLAIVMCGKSDKSVEVEDVACEASFKRDAAVHRALLTGTLQPWCGRFQR